MLGDFAVHVTSFRKERLFKAPTTGHSGMVYRYEGSLVWSYYKFFGRSVLIIDTSFVRHEL